MAAVIGRAFGGLVPERGPERALAAAVFVSLIGTGSYINTSALFFTRAVHLPVAQVGIGLTISGLVGLAAGIPAGRLADRWGPKRTWIVSLSAEALTMASFVFVHGFWWFVPVACLSAAAAVTSAAALAPVVRQLAGTEATRLRSQLRALGNLASSAGLVGAAVAVQLDSRPAYLALVLGNAASFAGCALLACRLPSIPAIARPPGRARWIALRDRPFVAVTLLDSVLSLQYPVLTFALPLWVVDHTHAPRWMAPADAFLNTVLCALLQVRASRGVNGPAAAGRAARNASFLLCAAFVLAATAAGPVWWLAALILVGQMCLQTLGEVRSTAAGFELSFGLAPAHAQGEYAGLFGMGTGTATSLGPTILGFACLTWGQAGWISLGALMVIAGLLIPGAVRLAEHTRPKLD